ncbi:hypothetical protein [Ferruginibacter albus]|uniref:hypothetical protein n=1 Tax=Ferruginibacter albus TaxID=2875540 RepID=UPI001CC55BC6|nr:hypothetical protein [Ferruginibacter albus]UAY50954.1 hypothetical protein K9M53_10170 [Ferruginibacter albus]
MDSFELILRNERVRSGMQMRLLISAINSLYFIFFALHEKQGSQRLLWILFALLPLLFFYTEWMLGKKKNKQAFSTTYLFLSIVWSTISIWICLVHCILLIGDAAARRVLKVSFSGSGVEYPSVPKKIISWNELDNVVLKDGLLTIDFKNNKLLQAEIEGVADEELFNAFCREQLKR